MLVLSRNRKQSIIINKVIRVTILRVRGGKVSLGIEAPEDVRVDRQEVFEKRESGIDTDKA